MGREDDDELRNLLDKIVRSVPQSPGPPPETDDIALRIGRGIAEAADRKREADMNGLRFNWDVPIVPLCTFVLAIAGIIWTGSDRFAKLDQAVASVKQQADISTARGLVYGPRVDLLSESNKVQDERISRLADSIAEIRKGNAESMSLMWTMREDLTMLRTQAGIPRRGQQ